MILHRDATIQKQSTWSSLNWTIRHTGVLLVIGLGFFFMPPQPYRPSETERRLDLRFDACGTQKEAAQAAMLCICLVYSRTKLRAHIQHFARIKAPARVRKLHNTFDGLRAKTAATKAIALAALDRHEFDLFLRITTTFDHAKRPVTSWTLGIW